jgi:hypothetical protein
LIFIRIVNFLLSFAVAGVLFALFYKILPNAHVRWRDKLGIGLYVSKSGGSLGLRGGRLSGGAAHLGPLLRTGIPFQVMPVTFISGLLTGMSLQLTAKADVSNGWEAAVAMTPVCP